MAHLRSHTTLAAGGEALFTHARISAAARQALERGSPITLSPANWRGYAKSRVASVSQKLDRLLSYIAERAPNPGSYFVLRPSLDFSLFDLADQAELNALIEHLKNEKLVTALGPTRTDPVTHHFGLTVAGFREPRHQLFRRNQGRDRRLPLHSGTNEGTSAQLRDHGSPARRAELIVPNFTGHKKGVYYEAGFARALGREVIMTCRESDFGGMHFDTNHMNHIKWSEPSDLKAKAGGSDFRNYPGQEHRVSLRGRG